MGSTQLNVLKNLKAEKVSYIRVALESCPWFFPVPETPLFENESGTRTIIPFAFNAFAVSA